MDPQDFRRGSRCTVLTVPGFGGSGPGHWQTLWEAERSDTIRAELGLWDDPLRNVWVSRLDHAIEQAAGPVILAAHSLGCVAVAWWARLSPHVGNGIVRGALLVAPADVDRPACTEKLKTFAPCPDQPLPFPSVLVASRDDPWIDMGRARGLARSWGSRFVDAGTRGHLNADSDLGAWAEGRRLLEEVMLAGIPARRVGRGAPRGAEASVPK